jgi:hypothetical protein
MAMSKQYPIHRKLEKTQELHYLNVPTKYQAGKEDMCRDNQRMVPSQGLPPPSAIVT